MKKTLVSALTTALVVGAASTTFAAANPFADVPADHWAYDAVAQLVQDGVVNGYSVDGTFKGDQNMSRYEMAQIVAKAMSRMDAADNNNKALIDKLAAEFSDELSNLGVRVADLEAKTDNVKWQGLIRYDWTHSNWEGNKDHENATDNIIKLRLDPSMTINENWTGHARVDADIQKDETGNATNKDVKRIYVEGKYGKFSTKLGRFGSYGDSSHGLVMDTDVTGAEFNYAPTDAWKIKATAARVDNIQYLWSTAYDADKKNKGAASYWDVEVDYAKGKWDAGLGYRNFYATNTLQSGTANVSGLTNKSLDIENAQGNGDTSFHVLDLGVGYAFDKNVKLTADYAWGPNLSSSINDNTGVKQNAYSVELDYKGADAAQKGSWGAYVAYRQLAPFASFAATYDFSGIAKSVRGFEIGASYTFTKNIIGTAKYFTGKDTAFEKSDLGNKYTGVFTRVDFIF